MHYFEHVPEINEILSLNPQGSTFLFDMDGTLINTEGLHAKAFFALLEGEKLESISQEKLYEMCLGQTDERIFNILKQNNLLAGRELTELRSAKNSLYISFLQDCRDEEVCLPEIGMLLSQIKSAGHKIGLVTSSDEESALASMKRFKFDHFFDVFVTEESTEDNKPHPAPYHLACEKLGATPARCVVFEDSPTGLAAAKDFGPGAIVHARWY